MSFTRSAAWPDYIYVDPRSYTRAKIRLIGLGVYTPPSVITNDFFAYIATRMGSPRTSEELERVTGLQTRHVRASTLDLCRQIAGEDAPGLVASTLPPCDDSTVDMAVMAARQALASAGREAGEIDAVL